MPPLQQQLAIDEIVQSIAPARAQIVSEISVLGEYRTRMVADVVTGKVDVTDAVARLPNMSDESGVLDEEGGDAELEAVEMEVSEAELEEIEA